MFRQIVNGRFILALVAILIVSGTIIYSKYLARKIAAEERQKVEEWVEAGKFLINSPADADTKLASMILTQNKTIPIIETNEHDSITGHLNLDSASIARTPGYLQNKLAAFRSLNKPIEWVNPADSLQRNRYYYGESLLLKEVRYYPLVQLVIVGLFIAITIIALRSSYQSAQNQVWAGMAKETAHQLGTPVSSLEGWVEMLREMPGNEAIVQELEKDVGRLRLVSDRFGKIGSTPQLEQHDIVQQINSMVEYIRKRATDKVSFTVNAHGHTEIPAMISGPLFDWVIENLLKNALDAMEGRGAITIDIQPGDEVIEIDVSDTGKGISKQNITKVFNPGFTTRKRGWGLGLSLSKRIIEQYHRGEIFVKQSEPGKGTTFRIVLKK
ncbi:MAG TPA: HAMP domain-containing sensor histidine kinase [Chitinophagaceae bacterium]|jgi:signal transduction histidine kinase|nr:HAMP domain-containing sensor histidine kinase [Chitinophagaceae bacterium]